MNTNIEFKTSTGQSVPFSIVLPSNLSRTNKPESRVFNYLNYKVTPGIYNFIKNPSRKEFLPRLENYKYFNHSNVIMFIDFDDVPEPYFSKYEDFTQYLRDTLPSKYFYPCPSASGKTKIIFFAPRLKIRYKNNSLPTIGVIEYVIQNILCNYLPSDLNNWILNNFDKKGILSSFLRVEECLKFKEICPNLESLEFNTKEIKKYIYSACRS